ncbi:hypothetical protein [Caulobacter henricii]|uniref:Uncharacterized protein n=1 Tax=Caulobacter henricii TaxID=69395 RepID=A0A0P0P228_9CAUL|nr:hypothetical protein [Caulobacter henricii]ALL14304.1 hypothetical protein AQ619_13640 [Caulobacter henricii]
MSDLLKMPADDVLKLADNLGNGTPAPPPPPPPPPSYFGYNSAETQALIDQLLKPQGPSAAVGMSSRPMVDLAALAAGGPASESSKRDDAAARQAYQAGKTRKLHNSLNDATACLRVQPTGVRTEWGIEGRYRLINTCDYPVSASWCANTRECELKRGNLWTIRPRGGYPIYFADLANPQIQIGGCREGDGKRPLPSDADLSRQGGVSEARAQPIPAVGVSLLPSHRCD